MCFMAIDFMILKLKLGAWLIIQVQNSHSVPKCEIQFAFKCNAFPNTMVIEYEHILYGK